MALGAMGLSRRDFLALTPDEFRAAYDSWHEEREYDMKERWEMVRTSAAIGLQPHVSRGKHLRPRDVLKFPWDARAEEPKAPPAAPSTPERFAKLVKQLEG